MKLFLSIVLGLLAAFFAAVLVAALSTGPEGVSALSLGSSEKSVAVAARELPAGHVLTKDDLTIKTMASGAAPNGAIGSAASLVGRTLIRPIVSGQALTSRAIAGTGTGPEIESMLGEGYRASTITLADKGPGSFVFPGSVVDVISIFEVPRGYEGAGATVSRTVLEGVKVLAVDGFQDAQKQAADAASGKRTRASSIGPTITLLVTPTQAQMLQLARTMGNLSVTLRPHLESEKGMGETLTLDQLLDLKLARTPERTTASTPRTAVSSKAVVVRTNAEAATEPVLEDGTESEEKPAVVATPRRWTTTVIRGHSRSTYTFEESE